MYAVIVVSVLWSVTRQIPKYSNTHPFLPIVFGRRFPYSLVAWSNLLFLMSRSFTLSLLCMVEFKETVLVFLL